MNAASRPSTSNDRPSDPFIRKRWFHILTLADQLRRDTESKKNEQLRNYAFDIPPADPQAAAVPPSIQTQTQHVDSFQNELLLAKTGDFTLDSLSDRFVDLKRTFNRMLEMRKQDVQQLTLATSITKAALLLVMRSAECIVGIVTNRTRKFPTLNSLISYIRSCDAELPIHGQLLVDWYAAADTLDLLLNDADWLVQPRKAYWAMQVCSETLAWARAIFNEGFRGETLKRAIFDRRDSNIVPNSEEKEWRDFYGTYLTWTYISSYSSC